MNLECLTASSGMVGPDYPAVTAAVEDLGHMILGDEGFVDIATLPGSFESFVGREAVLFRYRFHGRSAKDIDAFLLAADGRECASKATLKDWSVYLGRGLASLASIFNPEKIILEDRSQRFTATVRLTLRSLRKKPYARPTLSLKSPCHPWANGPSLGAASILHKGILTADENIVFGGAGPE